MYRLEKTFRFEASHILPNHDGKCARLHGHSWVGTLIIEGPTLRLAGRSAGMLVDFKDLSEVIDPIVEARLDHYHLNESTGLANPTSETLAAYVYSLVIEAAPWLEGGIVGVKIEETCTSSATYEPPPFKNEDGN